MMAATYHDVAYPLQQIDYWINDILKIFLGVNPRHIVNIGHIMPPIYDHFMQLISKEHHQPRQGYTDPSMHNLDWKFYNLMNEKLMEKDHGVFGGLILSHELAVREGFYERDGYFGTFPLIQLPSCHAICVHNLNHTIIRFKKHPHAFLLKICDAIQDWGRPTRKRDIDNIKLDNLTIESDRNNIPVIEFVLDISKKRTRELKSALSNKYLKTDKLLKISFKDINNNSIHEIPYK